MDERINKYLAKTGAGGRRKVEELISNGLVKIDGNPATLSSMVGENNVVTLNGVKVVPKKFIYLALNKPKGYVTTTSDPYANRKITDLIPSNYKNIFPVGRLDKDTSGLIIMTNDGDLAHKLTHPKYRKEKEYQVIAIPIPTNKALESLRNGILLEDGQTQPAKIKRNNKIINITITEGKNKQIRRMFEKIGSKVVELERIRINNLILTDLPKGKFRHLTQKERTDLER